jgi:GNAT superfamily N-acetyltransferase
LAGYTIEPLLSRASIKDYVRLFAAAFPGSQKLTEQYLEWLYTRNPDGMAIGADAFIGDELAAHYVTIPRRYRLGDDLVDAVLSVNTATHPDHQRKGLFQKIATATYDNARSNGFEFVVGAANAQSTHGFVNRLGFELLGQIRLALWCERQTEPDMRLDQSPEWLSWRLANPQARYFLTRAGADSYRIKTVQHGITFTLGTARADLLQQAGLSLPIRTMPYLPSLTPIFPVPRRGLMLPTRLQLSPWNVIMLPLAKPIPCGAATRLLYDGLAMDTF